VVQRGVLIPYDSLPGFVPQILLPLFHISPLPPSWLQKITDETNFYSKSRGAKIRVFQGDSKDKVYFFIKNVRVCIMCGVVLRGRNLPSIVLIQDFPLHTGFLFIPSFLNT